MNSSPNIEQTGLGRPRKSVATEHPAAKRDAEERWRAGLDSTEVGGPDKERRGPGVPGTDAVLGNAWLRVWPVPHCELLGVNVLVCHVACVTLGRLLKGLFLERTILQLPEC